VQLRRYIYKQGSRKHARSRVCFSLVVIAENKLECIIVQVRTVL